jgi:hypothetical protein
MNVDPCRRCSFTQPVRYVAELSGGEQLSGLGTTINFGGKAICFRADQDVPAGSAIELSIEWPVPLNESCGLRVVVKGTVLSTANSVVEVVIMQHEFRTAKRQAVFKALAAAAVA